MIDLTEPQRPACGRSGADACSGRCRCPGAAQCGGETLRKAFGPFARDERAGEWSTGIPVDLPGEVSE